MKWLYWIAISVVLIIFAIAVLIMIQIVCEAIFG